MLLVRLPLFRRRRYLRLKCIIGRQSRREPFPLKVPIPAGLGSPCLDCQSCRLKARFPRLHTSRHVHAEKIGTTETQCMQHLEYPSVHAAHLETGTGLEQG